MTDTSNPYAPPKSDEPRDEPDDEEADGLIDATNGLRFLNFFVDSIASMALLMVIVKAFAAMGPELHALGSIFAIGGRVFYYLFFEGVFGRSPGKWLTGTRVVDKSGRKPRFTQILGRTAARYVPFEPFSFLGSEPGGWHDRWSGTRVIKVRR